MAARFPLLAAVLVLGTAAVAAGCGSAGSSASSAAGASSAGSTAPAARSAIASTPLAGTGSGGAVHSAALGVEVKPAGPDIVETAAEDVAVPASDVAPDAGRLTVLAVREGGYVQTSNVSTGPHPAATLTVRVPNGSLPATMAAVGRLGTVIDQTEAGQDVTGQVVDLALEEANLQKEALAVRAILGHASKVSDVLAIQNELFTLQGEIQQVQAQRNGLANRVAYATLSVTLAAKVAAGAHHRARPGALARFWQLASGHTVQTVRGLFLAIGWFAPGILVLAAAGLVYAGLRWRRRRARAGATRPPGPDTASLGA
ncbi:MAG: DUF4349 domain-containing protein [Actinomycetota bacterium]|nr:DUF4349 domain-containing protein [Actinomycetota bacterium]